MDPAIVWDSGDLLVLDKPPGAVVHPSPEHRDATLILQHWLRDRVGPVSPVHRLDRPTSGLVLFARTPDGVRAGQAALEAGRKRYVAAVRRVTPEQGRLDRPLHHLDHGAAQDAVTTYRRLAVFALGVGPGPDGTPVSYGSASLLEVTPETGRRHQIRRHFAHEAHHLLLDTQYGKGRLNRHCRDTLGLPRLFLHLGALALPGIGDFAAPLATDLRAFLARVGVPWEAG